jgi:ParB family transcriptional regulator, chromosome partitioning protein
MTLGKRLGRGLGGLLQSTVAEPSVEEVRSSDSLPIAEIRTNPYQPRRNFDEGSLSELKASIAEHGILQPIVVRRGPQGYELVAGERRLRAARALGLERIPAVVRSVDDAAMQTLALVENLQREDLGPLEKARALKAMMSTQGLTQEGVADRVAKDRATIANLMRLLELPADVQELLDAGRLSAGQARAILQVQGDTRRSQLAQMVVERGLSVRDVERYARLMPGTKKKAGGAPSADPFLADLENRIRLALSAKVAVKKKGRGGSITIQYGDAAQLDAILSRMGVG